jgi:hypothetical protein
MLEGSGFSDEITLHQDITFPEVLDVFNFHHLFID